VRVVPHGVDRRFFAPAAAAAPVQEPYVLFVGTPEPRKNLARLAAALRLLRREGRRERLVVAGADGWGPGAPADPDVRFLGRMADDALPALYAGASCLAIPSLHEGFGLPALEAMAAGCPVVAADAGALPEVCGGAAVLVDPLDVAAIARGLARAVDGRDALVRAGRRRAQAFTWEAAAAAMLDVYREAAATASPGR
jgi:glycosyltransferase involved in cell wall biosynthesis